MDDRPDVIARHVSPDGALTLTVLRLHEGKGSDIAMGFEESAWHFHPSEQEALRIVEEVLSDRVVIMGWWLPNEPAQFELMDELEREIGGGADGIVYSFRLWSHGVSFEDLAEGRVPYTPLSDLWSWRTG